MIYLPSFRVRLWKEKEKRRRECNVMYHKSNSKGKENLSLFFFLSFRPTISFVIPAVDYSLEKEKFQLCLCVPGSYRGFVGTVWYSLPACYIILWCVMLRVRSFYRLPVWVSSVFFFSSFRSFLFFLLGDFFFPSCRDIPARRVFASFRFVSLVCMYACMHELEYAS